MNVCNVYMYICKYECMCVCMYVYMYVCLQFLLGINFIVRDITVMIDTCLCLEGSGYVVLSGRG